jgi:hypothetical protein
VTIKPPVTSKVPSPNDNEPRIVSLWKNLQKKLKDKDLVETPTKVMSPSPDSSGPPSFSDCKDTPHPMKDITNGLSVGNTNRKAGAPRKPRRIAAVPKLVKDSTFGVKSFSIPSYEMPSLKSNSTGPLITKSSFVGQCPPAIDPGIRGFDKGSDTLKTSTAQDCSDFASATFASAADITMEGHNLDSTDDEASMNADMSSSMEENMTIS